MCPAGTRDVSCLVCGGLWVTRAVCPTSSELILASGQSCDLPEGSYVYNRVDVAGTVNIAGHVRIVSPFIEITSSGSIDGTGHGYGSGEVGPGCSTAGGRGTGGSHGGLGGHSYQNTEHQPACGNYLQPMTPGSGGVAWGGWAGGAGGAAITLESVPDPAHGRLPGYVSINGTIRVNGVSGVANGNNGQGGAGAGGSILINATLLRGTGTLQANGGTSNFGYTYNYGGGGSGGRIAVYVHEMRQYWSGSTAACGGYGRAGYGAAGTMCVSWIARCVRCVGRIRCIRAAQRFVCLCPVLRGAGMHVRPHHAHVCAAAPSPVVCRVRTCVCTRVPRAVCGTSCWTWIPPT